MTEHVREALANDERLAELHIDVRASGGRLVLTGEVATDERRRVLYGVVSALMPDWEIVNQTTVVEVAEGPKVERLS